MANSPRPLVAGNWKMNGVNSSLEEIYKLAEKLKGGAYDCNVMICPPATIIRAAKKAADGSRIEIGAQDCHFNQSGAHTGDLSATILKDAGATAIIVGHSERRADHGETDAIVKAKAAAVHSQDLVAIICVGETVEQRKAGETLAVISAQIAGSMPDGCNAQNTVVAYEPVWAIGSGMTPTVEEVAEVHTHIRNDLNTALGEATGSEIALLYGGSVKPSNAVELMAAANVNGALVGGASLKADDFFGIIEAYE